MEEAPVPFAETPKPEKVAKEKILIEFTLEIDEKIYKCSIIKFEENEIKIFMILSNNPFIMYESYFNFYQLQNLNRNFRVYDNISQLANDLIGYINQKRLTISSVQKDKIILELNIIANIDNKVNITINRKNNSFDINQIDFLYEELEKKNKEIFELKNKIIDIEKERKEESVIKDKKITDLEKRLETLEKSFENNKNIKTINNQQNNYNNLERDIKELNIKDIKSEFKTIKTKKPVNEICLFPKSGNYIESSGPKIFDKNHNLIIFLEHIGFCEHICIINEHLVVLSQRNYLILLRLIHIKQGFYEYKSFNNTLKNITIKKIVRGLNEDEIITTDIKGNIGFWKIILKETEMKLELIYSIESKFETNSYLLLFKNILIVGSDKLYFYTSDDSNQKASKFNKCSTFELKPVCWNAMIPINESKNLIGVGSDGYTSILQINDINNINVIKVISIDDKTSQCDSLCLYQNNFLIIGTRQGNIFFYDIINNYNLIKKIEKAHQINKETIASINGITELSDGAIASFGEDKAIKIWYI